MNLHNKLQIKNLQRIQQTNEVKEQQALNNLIGNLKALDNLQHAVRQYDQDLVDSVGGCLEITHKHVLKIERSRLHLKVAM